MIYSEEDQRIIDEVMKNEKILNTFVPKYSNEKFINLSEIENFHYPFKPLFFVKNRGYKSRPNEIIVERIASDEEFRLIPDWAVSAFTENNYFISNYGRIFSSLYCRFLTLYDREGQYRVALSIFDYNKQKYISRHFPVHRLIMLTFQWIPNSDQYVVNHLDGNPHNNYILNLEWCTSTWNAWHRDHVLNSNSLQSNFKFIPASIVVAICEELMKQELNYYEIAKKYGVSKYIIEDIHSKHSYRYITKNYNFPESMHIFSDNEVIKVCELLDQGFSPTEVSKILNLSRSVIYDIRNGVYHRNISTNYEFSKKWKGVV